MNDRLLEELVVQIAALRRRVEALETQEIRADTVDGFHASAEPVPGQLLALNAVAKLPTSITGDADTVDGKHATQFVDVDIYTSRTGTFHQFDQQSWCDIPDLIINIPVQAGDTILAIASLSTANANQRYYSAAFRLVIGANTSDFLLVSSPGTSFWIPVSLAWAATATSAATWLVKMQVFVQNSGDTVTTGQEMLVIARIRPGGE